MSDPTGSAGRVRLAEVLATRGGRAEPEAPFVSEHREVLIYMLCQAAELLLFAAFSLKQRVDEGLTAEELEAVTRWRRRIAHVATEEMLHLALVQNVLVAVVGTGGDAGLEPARRAHERLGFRLLLGAQSFRALHPARRRARCCCDA